MLGFAWNQAGKTMGLASYGKELLNLDIPPITNLNFNLSLDFLVKDIYELYLASGIRYQEYITKNRADIAKTIQNFTEQLIISIFSYAINKYGIKIFV